MVPPVYPATIIQREACTSPESDRHTLLVNSSLLDVEQSLFLEELGIEHTGTGCPTHRVVAQQHVLHSKYRAGAHTADNARHAIFGVPIQRWLRAVILAAYDDRTSGRTRQAHCLRQATEGFERVDDFVRSGIAAKRDRRAFGVSIPHRNAVTVRREHEIRLLERAIRESTQHLHRFGFHLL